jgi:hypothetical protein
LSNRASFHGFNQHNRQSTDWKFSFLHLPNRFPICLRRYDLENFPIFIFGLLDLINVADHFEQSLALSSATHPQASLADRRRSRARSITGPCPTAMPLHVFYTIIRNENYLTSVETVSGHVREKKASGASVKEHFHTVEFSKYVTPLSAFSRLNALHEATGSTT